MIINTNSLLASDLESLRRHKMTELICIYFGGFLTLFIAFYHTQLYSKLNWSEDFEKIDKSNAQIFYTINLALTLFFASIGIISIIYAKELCQAKGLAFGICVLYSLFWGWRFIWQITYQRPNGEQPKPNTSKLIIPALIFSLYLLPVISKIYKSTL